MPFEFKKLEIPEVLLITPKLFGDERGFFLEAYKQSDFAAAGIAANFVQDNVSRSSKNVLRGLHYQKRPNAQAKLVRCLNGRIFDAAVDIRLGSPTYGRWVGATLDSQAHRMLYVPAGFAHGFLVLSETADVMYKVDSPYCAEAERSIRWDDPAIGIAWQTGSPVLSPKDAAAPDLKSCDNNFAFGGNNN